MYKYLISSFLFLTLTLTLSAQNQKYSRAKIWINDAGLRKLSSLGIETDHGDYRKNVWFISDFSESELQKINAEGFRTEIMIDNVVEYYHTQSTAPAVSRVQVALGPGGPLARRS